MALSGQKIRAMDMLEIVSFLGDAILPSCCPLTLTCALFSPHRSSALPDTPWRSFRSTPTRSSFSSSSSRSAGCARSSLRSSPLSLTYLPPSDSIPQIQPLPKYTTPAVVTACKAHAGAYLDYAHAYGAQDKPGLINLLDKHREVFEKVRLASQPLYSRPS